MRLNRHSLIFSILYKRHLLLRGFLLFPAFLFHLFLSEAIFAAEITVDHTDATKAPRLTQTDKGIPQVNIVNAENGLSHNRFEQYNVDVKGVVINNSRYSGTVEGLGYVKANRNLSEPAKAILFEVTGASRSELKGVSTIVGDQAKFILANPNGITCDGCGFINTHEVELRAERPHSVTNGQINWEQDLNGDIRIGKGGAVVRDGSLLLSAGKIKIEGAMSAKEILKAEAHSVQFGADKNGSNQGAVDEPKKKQEAIYAIDISTAAPITAGKVYLVATGEGAGVRIAALKSLVDEASLQPQTVISTNKEDVLIEAKGRIDIKGNVYSSDKLKIQGKDIALVDSKLIGTNAVSLISQNQLSSHANHIESGGNLTIQADKFQSDATQYGVNGEVHVKANNMTSRLSNLFSKGGVDLQLNNLESKVSRISSDKAIKITAKEQIALKGSDILSKEKIGIDAKRFGLEGMTQVSDAGTFYHLGEISGQDVEIRAKEKIENSGYFIGKNTEIISDILENRGEIYSTNLYLKGGSLFNKDGIIAADNILKIEGKAFSNEGGKAELKSGYLDLKVGDFKNEGLVQYYGICEQCKLEMDSFANHGRYITGMDFSPDNLKGAVLFGGELKAAAVNVVTEGTIRSEATGRISGLYGVGLFGKEIDLLGEIQSPIVQVDAKNHVINEGSIEAEEQFIFTGNVFENRGKIGVGVKREKGGGADNDETIKKDRFLTVPTFYATVKSFFINHGEISVGEETKGAIVIKGEDAEIENTGKIAVNKLNIHGKNVKLGGEQIDLRGETSELYVNGKEEVAVGNSSAQKTDHVLELNAYQHIFLASKFILTDNTILKDKGVLDADKGLFVSARDIECKPESVLDITSKIVLTAKNKDYLDVSKPQIITGKIIGHPALQIETDGDHRITNQLEISGLIYPNKLAALYFEGNLAKVAIKKQESLADKNQDPTLQSNPLKIEAKLMQVDSGGLLDAYSSLQLLIDKVEMAKGSQIKSQGWIDVISDEMGGGGAFYSGDSIYLLAKAGGIGGVGAAGIPGFYRGQANGSITFETPSLAVFGSLKTEKGDIIIRAQERAIVGDIDSGGNIFEILTTAPPLNARPDFDGLDMKFSTAKNVLVRAKKKIFIDGKETKFYYFNGTKVEAGEGLGLVGKQIYLEDGVKFKSGGLLELISSQGVVGKGDLESGGDVTVSSGGEIKFNSVHAQGNVFLRAKDTLSIKGDISTNQKGDVTLFGKKIEKININEIQDLALYGQEIDRNIKLSNLRSVKIVEEKAEAEAAVEVEGEKNTRPVVDRKTNFFIDTPLEIAGDFVFVGGQFVNRSRFKAKNIMLDLSGDFFNEVGGDITATGVWQSESKRFVNKQRMDIGEVFLAKEAEAFHNNNGGKISAGSIGIYVAGKDENGFSVYNYANSALETKAGLGDIDIIAPDGGVSWFITEPLLAQKNQEGLSSLLSRGGAINIQSGGDIRLNRAQVQGATIRINGGAIYLPEAAGVRVKSDSGFLELVSEKSITGTCDLESGGTVSVLSGGDIQFNSVHSQGNVFLGAKDTLSITGDVSTNKKGDVALYGNIAHVKNVNRILGLVLYGQDIGSFEMNDVESVEIVEKKVGQSTELVVVEDPNALFTADRNTNFVVNTPLELKGDFAFVGRGFQNNNIFKARKMSLVLSGNFVNQGEITTLGDFDSFSKGAFFNSKKMNIGGALQIQGDYFVNGDGAKKDGGEISAGSIKVYLTGKAKEGYGLYNQFDSVISSSAEQGGLELVTKEGGMYFGYKKLDTGEGKDKSGFTYASGRLLSRGGAIHIQSAGDVIFDGTKLFSGGDVRVQATGNIEQNTLVDRYLESTRLVVVGQYDECVRRGLFGCNKYQMQEIKDWRDFFTTVSLAPDIIAQGTVALVSGQSVTVTGNIFAGGKLIIGAEKDIIFPSIIAGRGGNTQSLPSLTGGGSATDIAFTGNQFSSEMEHEYQLDRGAIVQTIGGVDIVAKRNIEMQAPIISSYGDIKLEAKEGDIVGMAIFRRYLDKVNAHETTYAIEGRPGIIATLKSMVLFAPKGALSLKGVILTAENIEAVAKEIELSADHKTVIQYSVDVANKLFSHSKSEKWESHTSVLPTEMAARNIDLMATDGDARLKGVSIETPPEGTVNIKASKSVIQEAYTWLHTLITREEGSGLDVPGFARASAGSHPSFKDTVSHFPILEAIKNLKQTKSGTDLLPVVKFGTEVFRMLTAPNAQEMLKGQLNIPVGIGFFDTVARSEQKTMEGIPNIINAREGEISINAGIDSVCWGCINNANEIDVTAANSIIIKPFLLPTNTQFDAGSFTFGLTSSGSSSAIQLEATEEHRRSSDTSYIPSELHAQKNLIMKAADVIFEGSRIVGNEKVDIHADNMELGPTKLSKTKNSSYKHSGFSIFGSGTSVGVGVSGGSGNMDGSGYSLIPGYIGGEEVNFDVKNNAKIVSTQVEADKLKADIGRNLILETAQEVWDEHSSYNSWSASVSYDFATRTVSVTGSHDGSVGSAHRKWAEVPAWIKGGEVYIDVGKKCTLIGGGILGRDVTLKAKSLAFEDVHNIDESKKTSFGFDISTSMNMNQIKSGEVKPDRSFGNIVKNAWARAKGFVSFSHSESNQAGIDRATISKDAEIDIEEPVDLSKLNRDPDKMVETYEKDESTISFGVPIIDAKELAEQWAAKETVLQQMMGDTDLPTPDKEFIQTEKEVVETIKEEAIKEGLTPEDIDDVIAEVSEEEFAAKNLKKLSEHYEGNDIPVEEVIEVLQGKQPTKNEKGKIEFSEAPKSFDKYKEKPKENIVEHSTSSEKFFKPMEPWEEEVAVDDMLNVMTFGIGGAVVKIGGKAISKTALKALKFEGIKPAIEVLKRVTGRVKVEVVKEATTIGRSTTEVMTKVLRKAGYQEHHIIPKMKELGKHELVEKAGFDIESRANKMFMPSKGGTRPTRSLHRGAPDKRATDRLKNAMDAAVERGKAEGWTQQKYLERLQRIITEERSGLRSGEFKLNKAE